MAVRAGAFGSSFVRLLRDLDPAVAVRPLKADVVRSTPVAITLDRFYAPGLIALMLQHAAVIFGALALVREREQGTVELFRVAPVSPGERLVGKGVAFVALGAVVAAALTVLVVLAFRVPAPAQVVSWLLPATYAFTGFQELMLLGQRATPELFFGLGVIAVVLLAASRLLVPRRDALV